MSQLFVINGVDFTNHITVPNYRMNRKDVGDTWTDGNKTEHVYIVRQQIEGAFTFRADSVETYKLFCKTVNENKITTGKYSGAVLASMYLNNEDAFVSAYVRLSFDPKNELPYIDANKKRDGFEVTVKEV